MAANKVINVRFSTPFFNCIKRAVDGRGFKSVSRFCCESLIFCRDLLNEYDGEFASVPKKYYWPGVNMAVSANGRRAGTVMVSITLPHDLLSFVDDMKVRARCPTRTVAIRDMIIARMRGEGFSELDAELLVHEVLHIGPTDNDHIEMVDAFIKKINNNSQKNQ